MCFVHHRGQYMLACAASCASAFAHPRLLKFNVLLFIAGLCMSFNLQNDCCKGILSTAKQNSLAWTPPFEVIGFHGKLVSAPVMSTG